ncbi:MAG: glycosyltransferase family 39 protein [Fuerstiella sp.]
MSRTERHRLIASGLLTAVLIYVYPLFAATPLLEPDEGLHATISQEMLEHGEWVVPRFRGEPFPDKPILYFWAQMLSLKAFGMNELAVRLPGLMFGLLGSLATGLLAGRLFDSQTGLLACLISMSMFLPLSLAQAAAHDVALVPWTSLALLCLWEMERSSVRRRQRTWLAGAAVMFALAILTKALIGVAIIGIGYGGFLILSRQIRTGRCLRLFSVIVLGVLVASPWYLAMELRVSGYLYYYFVERHLLGFVTATQPHGHEPWYYYGPWLVLGAVPWTWYLVPLLRDEWSAFRRRGSTEPEIMLLLCWLIGGIVFLSVAGSKLVTYSLPLFPACSILCAVCWRRYGSGRLSGTSAGWFRLMVRVAGGAGMLVPAVVLGVCQIHLRTTWPLTCWLLAAVVTVISGVTWRTFERRQINDTAALVPLWVAGMACLVITWPLQNFAEEFSERSLADWVNRQPELPERLLLVGERPASVLFYLKPELRRAMIPGQFSKVTIDELRNARQLPDDLWLAVTDRMVREAAARQQSIPGTWTDSVGQFQIFCCEDQARQLSQMVWRSAR